MPSDTLPEMPPDRPAPLPFALAASALALLTLALTGCGLEGLGPIPERPPDAEPPLPDVGPDPAAERCAVGPWVQRDEACAAPLAGRSIPFALLDARTFCMGRPADCAGLLVDEAENDDDTLSYLARPVRVSRAFHLMRDELDRATWRAVVEAADLGDTRFAALPDDETCPADDCPARGITWSAAARFANLASAAAGLEPCYRLIGCPADAPPGEYACDRVEWTAPDAPGDPRPEDAPWFDCPGYRLPTEAEWEYAAHLDSEAVFFPLDLRCGSVPLSCVPPDGDRALLDVVAWYCQRPGPRPASAAPPAQHPLGLRELLGNVAEWVFDRRRAYAVLPATDPVGQPEPDEAADTERIARGGSYRREPQFVNVIRRTTRATDELRLDEVGLRLAVTFSDAHACEPTGE